MPTTSASPSKGCLWPSTAVSDMARFDIYAHPDARARATTPYLMDIQNNRISRLGTRVVLPLRSATNFLQPMGDLNPVFEVEGMRVVLDTAALAAFPTIELKKPVLNLQNQSQAIVAALDVLFGAY